MRKPILVNLVINLIYVFLIFYRGYGVSGGDLFIIVISEISIFIHLMILILMGIFSNRKSYYWGILGVLIGTLISFLIFQLLIFISTS
jgi:hypothetical protein